VRAWESIVDFVIEAIVGAIIFALAASFAVWAALG